MGSCWSWRIVWRCGLLGLGEVGIESEIELPGLA